MEKVELTKLLKEKYNEIFKIQTEIEELQCNYGIENTVFKKGDKILSETFPNDVDIILECNGDFKYLYESDNIYVDCEVVTSNNPRFKVGTIYTIPEKFLKLKTD
jgi:hypothetical protein